MSALAGPLHLVALVLVISGAQKVVSPGPAAQAMRDARLPVPRRGSWTGVALGGVEVATGLAVFAVPRTAAAIWLGAAYLALAGFVVLLRRRDATAGCGCFGAASAPPSTGHVVVDLASALVAFAAAATGVPDVVAILDGGAAIVLPYAVLLVTGAVLVLLGPALLAQIDAVGRGSAPTFGLRTAGPARDGAPR